jgi:hypothetical protein
VLAGALPQVAISTGRCSAAAAKLPSRLASSQAAIGVNAPLTADNAA